MSTLRESGSSAISTAAPGTPGRRAGRSALRCDQYPLLRVSAPHATAKAIEGPRLLILPGAGHDLPAPLWATIADEIRQLADRAAKGAGEGARLPARVRRGAAG